MKVTTLSREVISHDAEKDFRSLQEWGCGGFDDWNLAGIDQARPERLGDEFPFYDIPRHFDLAWQEALGPQRRHEGVTQGREPGDECSVLSSQFPVSIRIGAVRAVC